MDIGQSRDRIDLKEHIQANITDSQNARRSSNFKDHFNSENVKRIEHNAKLTTTTDGNLSVTHGLGYDAKKELDGIRAFLVENKKGENPFINNQGSHKGDPNKISIATATVTTKDGKTINYLAVSGKSWSGHAPNKVTIHGKEYQVLRDEAYTGKVLPDGKKEKVLEDKINPDNNQKNDNHAEKKIMSHITQQNQNGANIDSIQLNIQNTSDEFKGACYGCGGQDGTGGTIDYDRSDIKDRDNPKQPAFHGYQMILALNHEWERLAERCEQILSTNLRKDKKYLIDHRFYLALANGDKTEIETVLTELTSPKIAKVRNHEFAFTFTEHFIATHAVIYAKLAWLNGYEVEIYTPWIPKEWLPIQPLENYPEPWDFLREFDIWTSFEDYKDWSPKPSQT